jgi:uncharacterized protein
MLPRRFRAMQRLADDTDATVFVARSPRARLLGLAGLAEMPARSALLIPGCSAVHTFGMRFDLDVLFLGEDCEVIGERRNVGPGRFLRERGALAVLEFPSSYADPTSDASR